MILYIGQTTQDSTMLQHKAKTQCDYETERQHGDLIMVANTQQRDHSTIQRCLCDTTKRNPGSSMQQDTSTQIIMLQARPNSHHGDTCSSNS